MYEIVRGPLVWIAFAGFIGGSLYNLVSTAMLAKKEKTVFPTLSLRFGLRSLWHWLVPFNSRSMRMWPVLTLVSFLFHACLLLTPLFIMGHAVLWQQSWGIRWWSLPPQVADVMTIVVIAGGAFFLLRRLAAPEVRNVTTAKDCLLVLLVIAPFVTGLLARLQWLPHEETLIVHMVLGALWLLAIPFTWLTHMLWFAFSRAYMGSEFGAVRRARDW